MYEWWGLTGSSTTTQEPVEGWVLWWWLPLQHPHPLLPPPLPHHRAKRRKEKTNFEEHWETNLMLRPSKLWAKTPWHAFPFPRPSKCWTISKRQKKKRFFSTMIAMRCSTTPFPSNWHSLRTSCLSSLSFSPHPPQIVRSEKLTSEPDINTKLLAESSFLLYKRLQRQKVLRGFGSIDQESYPERAKEMSPVRMEQVFCCSW